MVNKWVPVKSATLTTAMRCAANRTRGFVSVVAMVFAIAVVARVLSFALILHAVSIEVASFLSVKAILIWLPKWEDYLEFNNYL